PSASSSTSRRATAIFAARPAPPTSSAFAPAWRATISSTKPRPRPEGREGVMKLVCFQTGIRNRERYPGLLTDRGVVDITAAVAPSHTPQLTMQGIIDDFERLRPALEHLAATGDAIPLHQVRLRAPLPRPGKILACIANYWEHAQ